MNKNRRKIILETQIRLNELEEKIKLKKIQVINVIYLSVEGKQIKVDNNE